MLTKEHCTLTQFVNFTTPLIGAQATPGPRLCQIIKGVKFLKENDNEKRAELSAALRDLSFEELPEFLGQHAANLQNEEISFSEYMRAKFREKGILQQWVFRNADISDNYGYKLIAGEKHTKSRDMILRICICACFTEKETQEALVLYGMAPLSERNRRDIVFLAAIRDKIKDIYRVNDMLLQCGLGPLL